MRASKGKGKGKGRDGNRGGGKDGDRGAEKEQGRRAEARDEAAGVVSNVAVAALGGAHQTQSSLGATPVPMVVPTVVPTVIPDGWLELRKEWCARLQNGHLFFFRQSVLPGEAKINSKITFSIRFLIFVIEFLFYS